MKYIMKSPGIYMTMTMKYPKVQNEIYNVMKSPGSHMTILMKYSKDQNEIDNEIIRLLYDNCNEIF